MTAALIPTPVMQFLDADGNPLVGGKVYTYAAGTSTPLATFTDYGGATPNANPVILNSRGEASIWFGTAAYKLELYTAATVLIWTADNVSASTPVVYGTGVAAALAINVGTAGSILVNGGALVGTTLSASGTATMAAINASGLVAMAGAATVGTTLGVTGTSTMAAINASGNITSTGTIGLANNSGYLMKDSAGNYRTMSILNGSNIMSFGDTDNFGAAEVRVVAGTGNPLKLYGGNTLVETITSTGSSITGTLGVTGAITGTTGTFTKAAAGDVLVLTNGGATPKPLYFYSDASTSSIGTSASQANSLLAFVGTTSMQINIAGGAVQTWTTAGTNVPGTLGVTGTATMAVITETTGAAWTTYTPTLTTNTGTFGALTVSEARYRILGKTLFISILCSATVASGLPTQFRLTYPAGLSGATNNLITPAILTNNGLEETGTVTGQTTTYFIGGRFAGVAFVGSCSLRFSAVMELA